MVQSADDVTLLSSEFNICKVPTHPGHLSFVHRSEQLVHQTSTCHEPRRAFYRPLFGSLLRRGEMLSISVCYQATCVWPFERKEECSLSFHGIFSSFRPVQSRVVRSNVRILHNEMIVSIVLKRRSSMWHTYNGQNLFLKQIYFSSQLRSINFYEGANWGGVTMRLSNCVYRKRKRKHRWWDGHK